MPEHPHGHPNDRPEPASSAGRREPHRDWRVWTAVALALLAMLAYVMSMDEALQPGGDVVEATPEVSAS